MQRTSVSMWNLLLLYHYHYYCHSNSLRSLPFIYDDPQHHLANSSSASRAHSYPRPPYLTLPFGAGVLPPSAEASSGPNAHPCINPKVIETFYRFLQTWGGCSSVPVLGHPFLRNTFQRIHIVSQRWNNSSHHDKFARPSRAVSYWPGRYRSSHTQCDMDNILLHSHSSHLRDHSCQHSALAAGTQRTEYNHRQLVPSNRLNHRNSSNFLQQKIPVQMYQTVHYNTVFYEYERFALLFD